MADPEWRATYAALLKQIRDMQRQLARVQAEASEVRERAAAESEKLKAVRTERRATARFEKSGGGEAVGRRRRRSR